MTFRKPFLAIALLLAVAGLVLDFWSMSGEMVTSIDHPVARSLVGMLLWFWTFLTHIVTLVVAAIYASELSGWRWLSALRKAWFETGTLAFLVLVGVYFHFMIAPLYPSVGVALWANWCLHYVGPALFLLWWLFAVQHGALRYSQIPKMLAGGVAYVLWVLVRGALVHEYPYAIFDPDKGGILAVIEGVAFIAAVLILMDLALVFADHMIGSRTAKNEVGARSK